MVFFEGESLSVLQVHFAHVNHRFRRMDDGAAHVEFRSQRHPELRFARRETGHKDAPESGRIDKEIVAAVRAQAGKRKPSLRICGGDHGRGRGSSFVSSCGPRTPAYLIFAPATGRPVAAPTTWPRSGAAFFRTQR